MQPQPKPKADHATPARSQPPLLVSVAEARRLLGGVGVTKFYEMLGEDEGRLQSVMVGRRRMVLYSSVVALAERGAP